jgi:hypothetical protein
MTARRKNSAVKQVRRAYKQEELAHILTLPEAEFGAEFGMKTTEVDQFPWRGKPSESDYYHFKDNGSRVLAVAHLDTVVRPKGRVPAFHDTRSGPAVVSGALDDRLGAYVITKLLPALGVNHDVLLTVGEEDGQSTASFFKPEKEYDHIIEFDRAGTDVVMYQYEDRASREAVQASGARVGQGSFSDICYLEQAGVKAFNWGVGYGGNYHSEKGYAILPDTFSMVAKYLKFNAQNAGISMPHTAEDRFGRRDEGKFDCELCGAFGTVDYFSLVCEYCRCCADCGRDELACVCSDVTSAIARDDTAYERWLAQRAMSAEISLTEIKADYYAEGERETENAA